ncbi:MAG: S1 RNA-binding domain-containing protein [Mycoplasmataceae bacterium]|jgi:predicted RNA-binding protein with RPS1 domain|nr:S1 RNA-binding domain-containing protein [Mycoplasmataceae bacterium]
MLKANGIYNGKVIKIFKTYALIKVENITGIVHISEISDYLVKNINDILTIGSEYNFLLLSIKEKTYNFSFKRVNAKFLKRRDGMIPTVSGYSNLYKNTMNLIKK